MPSIKQLEKWRGSERHSIDLSDNRDPVLQKLSKANSNGTYIKIYYSCGSSPGERK